MKKQKLLYVLALTLMMGACKNKNTVNESNSNINDTVFVAGVLDQSASFANSPMKHVYGVNKAGTTYEISVVVNTNGSIGNTERKPETAYIERGDTIVLKDSRIVKNITMENMMLRYVNGGR